MAGRERASSAKVGGIALEGCELEVRMGALIGSGVVVAFLAIAVIAMVVLGRRRRPVRSDGRKRPAAVRYAPGRRAGAEQVAAKLGADDIAPVGTTVPPAANLFELVNGAPHLTAMMRSPGSGPTGAVHFSFAGSVQRLLDGDFAHRFSSP